MFFLIIIHYTVSGNYSDITFVSYSFFSLLGGQSQSSFTVLNASTSQQISGAVQFLISLYLSLTGV